jgi:hypothetical protein
VVIAGVRCEKDVAVGKELGLVMKVVGGEDGDVITGNAGNRMMAVEGEDVVLEWNGDWDDAERRLINRSNSIKRR